jgi:hypothetical protein
MPPLPPSSSSPATTMRSPYTAPKSDNAFSQSAESSSPRYSGAFGSKNAYNEYFSIHSSPHIISSPHAFFENKAEHAQQLLFSQSSSIFCLEFPFPP